MSASGISARQWTKYPHSTWTLAGALAPSKTVFGNFSRLNERAGNEHNARRQSKKQLANNVRRADSNAGGRLSHENSVPGNSPVSRSSSAAHEFGEHSSPFLKLAPNALTVRGDHSSQTGEEQGQRTSRRTTNPIGKDVDEKGVDMEATFLVQIDSSGVDITLRSSAQHELILNKSLRVGAVELPALTLSMYCFPLATKQDSKEVVRLSEAEQESMKLLLLEMLNAQKNGCVFRTP